MRRGVRQQDGGWIDPVVVGAWVSLPLIQANAGGSRRDVLELQRIQSG